MSYVIGVDGGSTKTEAVVANLEGQVLGVGKSGCSNWEVVGEAKAAEAIFAAVKPALVAANADMSEVRHAHFGLSGLDWPDDEPRLRRALTPYLNEVPATLENDGYLAARACTEAGAGITVSAGSGVCSSYLGPNGDKYFYGYFGELGGGTRIDRLTLQAIIRAEDGRGPKTALTAAVLQATGHGSVAELLYALTRQAYSLGHTLMRPALYTAAREGDAVARSVVTTFGKELALLATNLIRKFELTGHGPEVVASGSLFTRTGPLMFEVFQKEVFDADPGAKVILANRQPVAGAVRAALRACGVETKKVWHRFSASYEGAIHA